MAKVSPLSNSVWKDLRFAWQGVVKAYQSMNTASCVRPRHAEDVFETDAIDGGVRITARPTVFNVPERASSGSSLYIVLRGWIDLARSDAVEDKLVTQDFTTEVGYFRATKDALSHVYGTHYDMDPDLPGHPVFHSQISTQARMAPSILKHFNNERPCEGDAVLGLLKNVRVPTPQMDVFSVVTQIAADHLLSETSGGKTLEAFDALRLACDFFLGAGQEISNLNRDETRRCFRSTHWY